jgi:hypothetical protein
VLPPKRERRRRRGDASTAATEKSIADAEKSLAERLPRVRGNRGIRRTLNRTTATWNNQQGDPLTNQTEPHLAHLRTVREKILKHPRVDELSYFGAEWLKMSLNPCDVSADNRGFPDMLASPVVTISERENFNIASDLSGGVTTGTYDPADTWSFVAISDPSTLCTFLLIYQGSIGAPTYTMILTNQDRVRTDLLMDGGIAASRVVGYGTTFEFTGPSVADQGEAVSAQLTPNWIRGPSGGTARTTEINVWPLNGTDPTVASPGELFNFVREVSIADPQCYQARAKLGAYFAHKICEPSMLMRKHGFFGAATGNLDNLYLINPFWTILNGQTTVGTTAPIASTISYMLDLYAFNAAIYHAQNLSTQSSYLVKKYVYVEAQVTPSKPFRYFTCRPPRNDPVVMEIYNHIIEDYPSAFPSDANAFGWLKKAWNWSKKAVKDVFGVIDKVRPVIEQGAKILPFLG